MDVAPTSPFGSGLLTATLTLGRAAAGAVEAALPDGSDRLAWRELGNKLDAFRWFQESRSGASPATGADDPFVRLWRTEGEGYRRAQRCPEDALPHPVAATSGAPGALLPLHTGLGLALATRALGAAPAARPGPLGPALDRFLAAAREAAAPGWEGAVVEALGLVARTLHPHRLAAIDEHLGRCGGASRELFWHGVGRGIYFAPTQAVPVGGPARRALEKALAEPPDDVGRAGAAAGVAWALTLVNLRSPEVVEELVARHRGEPGPLEHGICAALLVWRAAVGHDAVLARFLGHTPRRAAGGEAWRGVLDRCTRSLEGLAPALAASGRWGELFRYRPLDALEAELSAAAPRGGP